MLLRYLCQLVLLYALPILLFNSMKEHYKCKSDWNKMQCSPWKFQTLLSLIPVQFHPTIATTQQPAESILATITTHVTFLIQSILQCL
jgi:hypothetical protein